MCAIYQLTFDDFKEIKDIADKIAEKYGQDEANRCFSNDFYPKSLAPVVGPENRISLLSWGFLMKNKKSVIFNARSESLETSSLYKTALSNRCLIPATSFYEWDSDKTKYRISVENQKLFYFAGLWKKYIINGSRIFCYTIITTEPNSQISQIHNRMPAIITMEERRSWFENDIENALKMLKPANPILSINAI